MDIKKKNYFLVAKEMIENRFDVEPTSKFIFYS